MVDAIESTAATPGPTGRAPKSGHEAACEVSGASSGYLERTTKRISRRPAWQSPAADVSQDTARNRGAHSGRCRPPVPNDGAVPFAFQGKTSLIMSTINTQAIHLRAEVPFELGGQRLDQVAAQLFSDHSRSRLSAWIKDGLLTVDGAVLRPRHTVHAGAVLELSAEQQAQGEWVAQDIPLDIVFEDEHILVLNKPAG